MRTYPTYKDSGVEWIGKIPIHWDLLKVKNLFKFLKGRGLSKESLDDFGKYECILYGELFTRFKRYSTIPDVLSRTNEKTEILSDGDELLIPGSTTTTGVDLSNCKYLPHKDVQLSGDIIILKPYDGKLEQEYYSRFLTTVSTPEFVTGSRGVTIYHIYPRQIREIHILRPSSQEQTLIVSFLDTKTKLIDQLIDLTEKKIELLKEQRTSLINHCVTKGLNPNVEMKDSGVEWIGEIPSHWTLKKVSYLSKDMISGPFGSSLKKEFYTKSGYKIYGQEQVIKDNYEYGDYYVSEDKYQELKRCEIFPDDILVSCVGTFGKISLVPQHFEKGIINPRLLKITPKNLIKPRYFLILLRSNVSTIQMNILSRGGTMGVINLEILKQLKFPLPPTEEQTQIIEHLDKQTQKVDSTIEIESQRINLLKEYRQSLISEVVTGKIDVRDWKE